MAVVHGELVISGRKRKAIEADLDEMGFDRMPKNDVRPKPGVAPDADADADADSPAQGLSYEYLLSMAISSLTEEKVRPVFTQAHVACKEANQDIPHKFDSVVSLNEVLHVQVQALESDRDEKNAEVERMRSSTKEQLWREDLSAFEASYKDWLIEEENAAKELRNSQINAQARQRGKGTYILCF